MERELREAKRRLRRELSARRRGLNPELTREAGRAAALRVAGCQAFRVARAVALYAALDDELPTRPCFEALRTAGRRALLPRQRPDGALDFCAVERWEELAPGRYGVLEPGVGAPVVRPGEGDLVLVPGVAFDPAGNRLGRGAGFYDATFPPGTGGPLLYGFGFEFQVVEAVPHGAGDRRLDAIVTDRSFREASENER